MVARRVARSLVPQRRVVGRERVAGLQLLEAPAQRRPREPARRGAVGDGGAVAAQDRDPRAGPARTRCGAAIGTSPSPRAASHTRHAVHGSGCSAGGAGTSSVSSSRIAARQAATERLSGGRSSGGSAAVRTPWTLGPRDRAGRGGVRGSGAWLHHATDYACAPHGPAPRLGWLPQRPRPRRPADGRRRPIRRGALVRADALERLTADGWAALEAHGVRTVIDLRNDDEIGEDDALAPGRRDDDPHAARRHGGHGVLGRLDAPARVRHPALLRPVARALPRPRRPRARGDRPRGARRRRLPLRRRPRPHRPRDDAVLAPLDVPPASRRRGLRAVGGPPRRPAHRRRSTPSGRRRRRPCSARCSPPSTPSGTSTRTTCAALRARAVG